QLALTCVKPWLLPNSDPTPTNGGAIFNPATGAILLPGLLGGFWNLKSVCGDCSPTGDGIPDVSPGHYYPGATEADDFRAPTKAWPACSAGFNSYQLAIAGCVPRPIRCGAPPTANVDIDVNPYTTDRDEDTFQAASCLIHYTGADGDSDSIDTK